MPFTGRAVYSTGVHNTMAEDVSPIISMISPFETPFLDFLDEPEDEAENVLYEWLEDELGPNTIVSSTAHAATTGNTIGVHALGSSGAVTGYLQVGMILKNKRTLEYMQIAAVTSGSNTIGLTRAVGGTSAATINAQDELFVVSTAELEGAGITTDVSVPRSRPSNYLQIFKKDVILSETVQAVTHIGVDNEFDRQKMQRIREVTRDLEKAAIQGISLGNTIGSSSAYRTFNGVLAQIVTNIVTTMATITTITQVEQALDLAWGEGADNLNLIVCDRIKKSQLNLLQAPRVTVNQGTQDKLFRHGITTLETDHGTHLVLKSRWMPDNSMMILDTSRVHIVPLKGRSFAFHEKPYGGDARTGYVVGEYTVRVRNEKGLVKVI